MAQIDGCSGCRFDKLVSLVHIPFIHAEEMKHSFSMQWLSHFERASYAHIDVWPEEWRDQIFIFSM